MKHILSMLSLAMLISCPACLPMCRKMPKEAQPQEQLPTQAEQKTVTMEKGAALEGGVVHHFEDVVKGKDPQTVFNEILASNKIVVVDFFAVWCGPCQALGKQLPGVAMQNKDVLFIKVDVDKFNQITAAQGVRSMPTLKLFKNGTQVFLNVGWGADAFNKLKAAINAARS